MSFKLAEQSVAELVAFVDRRVRESGCDHSHRFTEQWAQRRSLCWDDMLDALEARGVFCDCEVVLNLEGASLFFEPQSPKAAADNPWLLPPGFAPGEAATISKVIVARSGVGRNNYAHEGEWLAPAPTDAKPRKRVRKSVHFFIGVESGLPTEIGFVADVEPISLSQYVEVVRSSVARELKAFDLRAAAFVFKRIAKLPSGAPVGANIVERVGVASKHEELTIHRVVLR